MGNSEPQTASSRVKPRIIIHGGAGNISRTNLTPIAYAAYRKALLSILSSASSLLNKPGSTALDVATYAVSLLEDEPLFNAGKGAVFTRAGTTELESSIMVSDGYRKRGVGCMLLSHVKNPIKLAREMLIRGEETGGGGAQGHCQLAGPYAEKLAQEWGLEMVDPSYFFTQKRWDEHLKGLEREKNGKATIAQFHDPFPWGEEKSPVVERIGEVGAADGGANWNGKDYLPQGTVGAVVLDGFGTVCVATSTGGLTNKLPGRIGDTPTLGAGFWAEEWFEETPNFPWQATTTASSRQRMLYQPSANPLDRFSRGDLHGLLNQCLPGLSTPALPLSPAPPVLPSSPPSSTSLSTPSVRKPEQSKSKPKPIRHAVAMSGTGNGDSFLRLSAVRTAAAMSRFSSTSLSEAVTRIAGPGGELQKSAGERWGKTGEGEGGIIGIECVGNEGIGYEGKVVWEFNCGGMFRAWVDDEGGLRCAVFREEVDSW